MSGEKQRETRLREEAERRGMVLKAMPGPSGNRAVWVVAGLGHMVPCPTLDDVEKQLAMEAEADDLRKYLEKTTGLDLSVVPAVMMNQAVKAWEEKCVESLLVSIGDNVSGLAFCFDNHQPLREAGLWEKALRSAYVTTRTSWHAWSMDTLHALFYVMSDADRLRAAGDALPFSGRITLYRGVAGERDSRHEEGMSWTTSIEVARWFARRHAELGLADPAILETTVDADEVLAYSNGREEQDCILYANDFDRVE